MIEDQNLRLDVIIIAALLLLLIVICIVLFITKWPANKQNSYCDRHPDDTDRCVCDDRLFESENQRYHWQVCQDMIQYVEDQDCEMFLEISTCIKARKKTISDLNCTELKEYFENGRACEGVWPHRVCRYPKTTDRADVLYQVMLKC